MLDYYYYYYYYTFSAGLNALQVDQVNGENDLSVLVELALINYLYKVAFYLYFQSKWRMLHVRTIVVKDRTIGLYKIHMPCILRLVFV